MRIGELSCGPKKELKAFGLIFHWQQVWKERAYLKASVVGRISGSLKVWTHGQGPLNWTRGPNIHQKLGSLYQGEIASVGFTAWKTGVAELCSTIGRFPAVVRDLIKLLKLPWQSEGSVYKDPKRLTQLGLKLLWVYQWFMQCRSKWQKARFCHFHLWAGMLASSSKYWETHSRAGSWQYAPCFRWVFYGEYLK